jgi:hypothetical protein
MIALILNSVVFVSLASFAFAGETSGGGGERPKAERSQPAENHVFNGESVRESGSIFSERIERFEKESYLPRNSGSFSRNEISHSEK